MIIKKKAKKKIEKGDQIIHSKILNFPFGDFQLYHSSIIATKFNRMHLIIMRSILNSIRSQGIKKNRRVSRNKILNPHPKSFDVRKKNFPNLKKKKKKKKK